MNAKRIYESFFLFGISGAIGVLADLDHILCGFESGIPLWPLSNLYGCKIWHANLPMVSAILVFAIGTLGLGLVLALVYDAARSRFRHN